MRRSLVLLSCLAAGAGLGACGGGDDAPDTRLTDALASVSAGESSERRFAWSDLAALRELAGGEIEPGTDALRRWSIPIGTGASELVDSFLPLRDELELDVLAADRTTTVGIGLHGAMRVDGVRAAPVADALEARGAAPDELGERAVLRPQEPLPIPEDPLARIFVTAGGAVLAEGETVAFSGDDAALLEVLGEGDEPLGDRPDQAAAAACLGDVVSAEILKDTEAGALNVSAVGLGVRGGEDPVEVLCAVGDEDRVQTATDELRENLTPEATSIVTNQPLSELLEAVEVETGEAADRHWVRAVVTPRPERPLGLLWQALATNELAAWLGGAG